MAENHQRDRNPPPAGPAAADFRRLTAAVLLAAAIIGFYWRYTLTNQFIWYAGDDFLNQVLPWFQFQAGEIHQGRLPLWDPNHYLGQPLVGQAQPGTAYPLNWLLFSLPLREGWIKAFWLNWYYVFIHLMAAFFAYSLARELKVTRAGAILAGAVYSLASWLGTTTWPQMINGAVWAPLVFRFILRVAGGSAMWRNAVFGGFFLGVAWLSGHHQIPIFTSLAAAGTWLWIAGKAGRGRAALRALAAMGLFFLIAGCAGALQILPAQEYGMLSARWVGLQDPIGWNTDVPYIIHREFSLHPISLLGVVFPGMVAHSDPFLGVMALLLGVLAIASAWSRPEVRLFTAISAGGLLFSLAHHSGPLHGVIYSLVPMVDKARSPSMAIHIFAFGASVLAAFGFDALRGEVHRATIRRLALVAWGIAGAVLLIQVAIVMTKGFQRGADERPMTVALAGMLAGGLLMAAARGALTPRVLAVCAAGLFLVEVSNTNSHFDPAVLEKERVEKVRGMSLHSDIAQFLKSRGRLARVDVESAAIPYNFGDWYGLPQSGGYLASLTKNVTRVEMHTAHARRLLGIEYLVSSKPTEDHREEVFTSSSGLKVFRNPDVLPRVFTVHEAVQLPSADQAALMLFQMRDELTKRTFVSGPPPALERCPGADRAEVLVYEPSRIRIAADMACRGMIVLTDTYFPGWNATVDGQPATIHEVYGVVRGIVADRGAHTIEFRYRPASLIAGAILTLFSALLVSYLWIDTRRQRPR